MRRTAFSVAQIFSDHLPKIPAARRPHEESSTKYRLQLDGMALAGGRRHWKEIMHLHIEKIGEMTIIECAGRVVSSDNAFRLRDAVTSQRDARIIVVDLSEVRSIEGGGLGMLAFLGRWAHDHDIQFKLFNPTKSVCDRLESLSTLPDCDIATLGEMMDLLANADTRYTLAA
jgi:anti-anti-sigma regulatory factor